jgi:formamidopyrimidine-DNA glycosylase
MPELPDVEGFRAVLAEYGAGRRVEHAEVAGAGVLLDVSAARLEQALRGHRVGDPERLIARTDGPALLMHFGMTGELHWAESGEERHRHDRAVFAVPGGEFRFCDMGKLQGMTPAGRPGDIGHVLAGLALRRPVRQLETADRASVRGQMRRVLRDAVRPGRVPARPGWLTASRDADRRGACAAAPRTPGDGSRAGARSGARAASPAEHGGDS